MLDLTLSIELLFKRCAARELVLMNIYVGNLYYSLTESELRDAFAGHCQRKSG